MADQDDVAAGGEMHLGLAVHLADQRAGGVEIEQLAPLRILRHRFRHAVGGEHHRELAGNLLQVLDEDRALALQLLDHVPVVDDLVPHIDRRAIALQGALHDLDGAVHPGAEAARRRQQQGQGIFGHRPSSRFRMSIRPISVRWATAISEIARQP